ncbi:hypothetical protein SAMN05444166_1269 [Singulisphaera sp. GP187]|uniref:hypothetical protein n=1 Tax=Singulisphaera sp. GP187 TaxID=1882752 RepID=UPI0009296B73|nr:hypothetical protein [Singulisphaera sp. GP187]SIN85199.1 hypothetical protein SAMN05444166_1269 [Singulisphaera sp. GP187]
MDLGLNGTWVESHPTDGVTVIALIAPLNLRKVAIENLGCLVDSTWVSVRPVLDFPTLRRRNLLSLATQPLADMFTGLATAIDLAEFWSTGES